MKKFLIIFAIALCVGCKENAGLDPEINIVGKWRLVSYCKSPGGLVSGCQKIIIPKNKAVYIEFSKKGTFKETYKNTIAADFAFLGCGSGSYSVENGDVRIKAICMSSMDGMLIEMNSLTSKKMVLKPLFISEYIFEKE